MQRNKILLFIILSLIFFNLSFASASFKHNSHELKKTYLEGETIKGSLNLNITNENVNSLFESNFLGNISLIELIKESDLTEGDDFTCSNFGCENEYELGSALTEFNLNGEKTIALKITGKDISSINNLEFSVDSELGSSCETPLLVDVLSKGENIVTTNSYTLNYCGEKNYGCFDKNLASSDYSEAIIDDEVCENITLKAGPAYSIGANAKKEGNQDIDLILRDFEFNELGRCNMSQQFECVVNYSSAKNKDFWVCASGNFKIKSESKGKVCGTENNDFEIFARPLEYGKPSVKINNGLFDGLFSISLESYAYDYINEKYEKNGSLNCEPYCAIPIKFTGLEQKVKISNISLRYSKGNINFDAPKESYDTTIKPSSLNGNNIKINLDKANFIIPMGTKAKIFELQLGGKSIFKENITLSESFNFELKPKFALIGVNTGFSALTDFNITSSKWNFGDGTTFNSNDKKASHKYLEIKTYKLEVELARKDGVKAIKTFDIVVGNPKESAERTIKDYRTRLNNITSSVKKKFPGKIGDKINEILDIVSLNKSLNELEKSFKDASSDEDYINVVENLMKLNVPEDVASTEKGKLPIAVGFENIDIDYYKEIVKEDKSLELTESLIGWSNNNYDADAEFEKISAIKDGNKEAILTRFKFIITKKTEQSEAADFVIDYSFDSLDFSENYGQKPILEGRGAYIPINNEITNVEFFIEDDIDLAELGAHLTPLRKLVVSDELICEPDDPTCQKPFPWGRLFFWLGIAIVIIFIFYIALQEWYKRHYENYLFKNSNELYNLINFVYNSRNSGLNDSEIKKKLRGAGWDGEKITYGFKKLDGKRTGMWEIPIFRMFERKKVMDEIAKRQGGGRFIKQSGF